MRTLSTSVSPPNDRPWWRRTLPLETSREVWARIGFRCIWCTIPYFSFALVAAALGDPTFVLSPFAVVALIVPVIGGMIDAWKLNG